MYNSSSDEEPEPPFLEPQFLEPPFLEGVMSQSFEEHMLWDREIPFSACQQIPNCLTSQTRGDTDEPRSCSCKRSTGTSIQPGEAKADQMITCVERNTHCINCGMGFNELGALKMHQRVHSGEKPFVCKECDQGFNELGALKNHLRIHSGEKPFVCKECDNSFYRLHDLKMHQRIHMGETAFAAFVCKQCDQGFNQIDSLIEHQLIHTGKKPVSCPSAEKCPSEEHSMTVKFPQTLCWTVYPEGGPKTAVHVAVGHKLYAFGRCCDGETHAMDRIPVHIFNTVALHWMTLPATTPEVPSMRSGHTAVLVEGIIYVWGGFTHMEYCNVLYAFNVNIHKWFKPRISGTVPDGRQDHSACIFGKVMYIYGGWTKETGGTNAIYKLDTTRVVWSLIIASGTVSDCHTATIIGTKMFVFGGWGDQGSYYDAVRVFDTETNCWLNTPSTQLHPERRRQHSAFTYNGKLYIFGGFNLTETFSDLWKYNPETFSWMKVEPMENGLCSKYNCCCLVGDRVIFLGGRYTPTDDIFILDFNTSLKTLGKLAVIHFGLAQSELRHDIRLELAVMTK